MSLGWQNGSLRGHDQSILAVAILLMRLAGDRRVGQIFECVQTTGREVIEPVREGVPLSRVRDVLN